MVKKIILLTIRIYQIILSPDQGIFSYPGTKTCRFYPSCSEYTYQAVKKYGSRRGVLKGIKRILHCHPWNQGGLDPLL